jgi:uncharacterized membrane protein YjgN (DUF898 family)
MDNTSNEQNIEEISTPQVENPTELQERSPQPEQPQTKKVYFVGNFLDYFIKSILLLILCIITFGLLTPYFLYWNAKYFVNNLEIEA